MESCPFNDINVRKERRQDKRRQKCDDAHNKLIHIDYYDEECLIGA